MHAQAAPKDNPAIRPCLRPLSSPDNARQGCFQRHHGVFAHDVLRELQPELSIECGTLPVPRDFSGRMILVPLRMNKEMTMKYWTEDRVKTLISMWLDGNSAGKIADTLGGTTRNAVIGKVYRLGYSNRKVNKRSTPEKPASGPPRETAGSTRTARKKAKPESKPAPVNLEATSRPESEPDIESETVTGPSSVSVSTMLRKNIIPAGQPLPPQPSPNEVSEEALALVAAAEKKSLRLGLMDLTDKTCKWPVGDPASDDFWFCGLSSEPGKPYCAAHAALAFQPMSARRDRRTR